MSQHDDEIVMEMPLAYLPKSGGAVFFSKGNPSAGETITSSRKGTALPIREMQNLLKVAYWGEDNRFPQNVEQQMAYCGIGKSALDWKAKALYGNGIIPGMITGYEDGGKKEIFKPLDRTQYKEVYSLIENRRMYRFFLEYLQDWTWYFNCFPEVILSNDGKTITGLVHQESCDCRYRQMNGKGEIDTVYLSKLWGLPSDQYVRFDPGKKLKGLISNGTVPTTVDNVFVKELPCIDPYDPVESLKKIAAKLKSGRLKSAILPVNYPSPNKTYYQLAYWDGARLSGWVEIAAKIPALIKTLYNKAFRLKYHIQVPEIYFEKLYGKEEWAKMGAEKKQPEARKKLGRKMDEFLASDKNAFNSFISYFDIDPHTKQEYGLVKINSIDDKSSIDKDLIIQSAAGIEILTAAQVHPTLFSAGMTGSMYRSGGGSGSDIREAYLVYNAQLNLERNVMLEPLYLIRDYNRIVGGNKIWDENIVFRIRDTVLTTLDQGKGTEKVVS